MKTMRAVRLVEVGKPLEMQEIPIPSYGRYDVLVRVMAAGICHSDVHYRTGKSQVYPLPMTLGHEVSGVVEKIGSDVTMVRPGDRVCLHYMVTCGNCYYCSMGSEQFCEKGKMLGHFVDGGYAEYIAVPERNAVLLPDEIPFEHGATMMCASATSLHAIRKSRLKGGETLAVFGVGGLGMSAIQLAKALGARDVYAVDIHTQKLEMAARFGAIPVNAAEGDPVEQIRHLTGGKGVDVSLELIGLPLTIQQALRSAGVFGRVVVVGISDKPVLIDTYHDLLGPETELIGSNDHLLSELHLLIDFARRGVLDLSDVISRVIPLDAAQINRTLDALEYYSSDVRTVIVP